MSCVWQLLNKRIYDDDDDDDDDEDDAFTSTEAGTEFSEPGAMQGWAEVTVHN